MANDNSLLDIANNGAALNQALSELTTNVAKLSDITLPASNGGTGQGSLTANNVLLGNGTNGVQFVAPGSSGNVLTSNGSTWISAAIPSFTGVWTVPNGGTGRSSLTQYALLAGGTTATGNVQSLGTGTSGQVLTSSGSSAVPVFQTLTQTQVESAFNATGSAPFYACRAWVNFNGTTTPPTVRGSGNVSSTITKNSTGNYTITFLTALPDANYSVVALASNDGGTTPFGVTNTYNLTTTSVRIYTGESSGGTAVDRAIINVVVFR